MFMFAEPVKTGDPETDKIVAEMAAEGLPVPEFAKKPSTETPAPKVEEEEEEEEQETEPAEEEEESEEEAESEEDEEETEDETESEEEEDEEEEEVETETSRNNRSVPLWKVRKMEKKFDKFMTTMTEKLEQLASGKSTAQAAEDIDAEIKKLATETKSDPAAIRRLVDLAVQRSALPAEVMEQIKEFTQEREVKREEERQDKLYVQEFTRSVLPLIRRDNPNATQEDVDRINNELYRTGFFTTPENARKSLVQLYLENPKLVARKGKTTAEVSGRSPSRAAGVSTDYENVTDEDIAKMSDEEFAKYSDYMGSHHGGMQIHRAS